MTDDVPSTAQWFGQLRAATMALGRVMRARPFTFGVATLVFVAALVTGPIIGPHRSARALVGTGFEPLVEQGHWWSPVTAVLFTNNLVELVVTLILVVVLIGAAEGLMGFWRTALAFVATPVIGTVLGVGIQVFGNRGGEMWSRNVVELITLDPLTAIGGTIMTASGFASVLWRRRIRVLTLVVCLVFLLYSGQPSDMYRLLAVIAGLGLGPLLRPAKRVLGWVRSSHHEIRVLMASVVALTAVGPVVALLSASRYGPLAPIGLLFTYDVPNPGDLLDRCQVFNLTRTCLRDITLERINGVGPILVSVIPLLVLLVAAYGLLRGRRFALWIAVAVNGMLAVLAAYFFGFLPVAGEPYVVRPTARYWEIVVSLAVSVALPLAIAILLVVMRRHFPVLTSARRVRQYVVTIVVAALGLALVYVVVGYLFRETAFTRPVDVATLLSSVSERFIPVAFLRHQSANFLPASPVGMLLYHGVGPVFWAVVILAAIRPIIENPSKERGSGAARARALLTRGGGDALAFMTTWAGNSYWFDPVGGAAVAYRVVGRVALTTGGPFGTPGSYDGTIERFARYCDDNGWVPVFYSVAHTLAPDFESMGWTTMVVAEETVVRPQKWNTSGKKWQDVRTSVNRAERAGIRAVWTSYGALPLGIASQLSEISEQWVAEKDLPEMGFTLGSLDELHDPAVRLMLALDADGWVQGVTSWLPAYRNGAVVGWTLDFMRRRPGSINGVMEFLIAESATRMREEGVEFMSLSAAPLAHTAAEREDEPTAMDRVLGYLSSSLEPVYGFRSLLKFKRKFQPEFRPLIMAYPDPVTLPLIGAALVRAYLPGISVRQAANLVRGRR
ncbi:MAG TPA: DUF2156 domain-containing protein [Microbacteriaceae bacterium]|nr:DUF2156 domain-containing protein [Microbacteriaceae bacterium]